MNTFTLKGSVVSNESNCLVIEVDDEVLIPVSYFASSQIEVGARVEIEGHLAPAGGEFVQAMASEVHVFKQLVLGGAPDYDDDDASLTMDDGDITIDGE